MPRLPLLWFGRISVPSLLFAVVLGICCSSSCLLAFADVDMPPNVLRSPPQASVAAETEKSHRPRHKWLVVDFDCTLTKYDTTPTLPLLAALHSGDDDAQRRKRLDMFANHEKEYFDAYSAVKEQLFDNGNADGGEDDDLPNLHDALESLDDVSTLVTKKVSESSCLAGLPSHPDRVADIIGADSELRRMTELQDGCTATVANAYRNGWGLAVLSINWYPSLIHSVFVEPWRKHVLAFTGQTCGDGGDGNELQGSAKGVHSSPKAEVWCNDIDGDGVVTLHLPGSSAKRRRIQALREQLLKEHQAAAASAESDDDARRPLVIYIGDSSTDLSGLLEADIGIMIGRSSTVQCFADQWKIPLAPLTERTASPSGLNDDDANTVWMVDTWEEIEAFLSDL